MDTGVIIAIVVVVLILLALFALMGRKSRDRKRDANRHEAREIRREAEVGRAQADKSRAEADVQAAEARRQDAEARESAVEADDRHREARDRHLEAANLDPDVDERVERERYDREHDPHGITGHGHGEEGQATETADAEHERRVERDERGDVVRDEEHDRPRPSR